MKLGSPLAAGGSSEIFAWGSDETQVVKLFRTAYSDAVDTEAERARAVFDAGVPVPRVDDVVEVEGRRGIVFERLHGPTLLDCMVRRELSFEETARDLAKLHRSLHAVTVAGLPTREVLVPQIAARLEEPDRSDFIRRLSRVPEGDRLYHGDFHPGNVVRTREGDRAVDWPNAALAHPSYDVARSIMTMRFQVLPGQATDDRTRRGRARLAEAYVAAYLEGGSISREEIDAGLSPHAMGLVRAGAFAEEDRAELEALEGSAEGPSRRSSR